MALKLKATVTKNNGTTIELNYWEIEECYWKKGEKFFQCELRGYESKQKQQDYEQTGEKTHHKKLKFSMSGPDFPDISKRNFINDVFAYIKTQNREGINFSTATNE